MRDLCADGYHLREDAQPAVSKFIENIILLQFVSHQLLPPANEVCEGYVFSRVCHSVHGGGTWVGAPPGPGTQVPPPPPREQCMLGDTGDKWAVRTILECILVFKAF